jgi:hypothetical protein
MKRTLVLEHSTGTVTVIQEAIDRLQSAESLREYEHEIDLTGEPFLLSSSHGLKVEKDGRILSSLLLLAVGGASGVHPHSAFLHGDRCIVAVGNQVCALQLPELTMIWKTEVDWATCFGVFHSLKHECYISHGEGEIARLDYNGQIEWTQGGPDIFTGDLELLDDRVEVFDFNGTKFVFAIGDGKLLSFK